MVSKLSTIRRVSARMESAPAARRCQELTMIRHVHLTLAACLALSACVTINVYFPAAAAEKAADKLINEVWGEGQTTPKQDEDKRGDLATQEAGPLLAAAGAVLEFLVPSA